MPSRSLLLKFQLSECLLTRKRVKALNTHGCQIDLFRRKHKLAHKRIYGRDNGEKLTLPTLSIPTHTHSST